MQVAFVILCLRVVCLFVFAEWDAEVTRAQERVLLSPQRLPVEEMSQRQSGERNRCAGKDRMPRRVHGETCESMRLGDGSTGGP